jgi:hypothetical protein
MAKTPPRTPAPEIPAKSAPDPHEALAAWSSLPEGSKAIADRNLTLAAAREALKAERLALKAELDAMGPDLYATRTEAWAAINGAKSYGRVAVAEAEAAYLQAEQTLRDFFEPRTSRIGAIERELLAGASPLIIGEFGEWLDEKQTRPCFKRWCLDEWHRARKTTIQYQDGIVIDKDGSRRAVTHSNVASISARMKACLEVSEKAQELIFTEADQSAEHIGPMLTALRNALPPVDSIFIEGSRP